MKTILVCGGRDYNDKATLYATLDKICFERDWKFGPEPDGNWLPNVRLVNGKARGADTLATDWAITNWCAFKEYPADWDTHGKAAGPIRNQQMLDSEAIDLVVAFPGGRGTADMVKRARDKGIEVIIVE